MTQKIRGRHRRQGQRAAVMGALPIAIAISYSSVAVAAPQPGTTDTITPDDEAAPSTAQPGTTDSITPDDEAAPSTAQPGTTAESDSDKVAPTIERTKQSEPKSYWIAPPAEYNNVPTRELPTYNEYDVEEEAYVAPESVQVQELHLPTAVDPVAPIEAPEDKLRIGDYITEKPAWMSEQDMEKTNNSAAVVEAQVATFWNSVGVETSRSDRIAAATTAGAITGGVTGAAVCGIPAAVVGGLIGGTIGGPIGGATVGLPAMVAVPVVGAVPGFMVGGAIGTTIGAAAGAAIGGVPAAAVCGTAGAVIGGAAGANFGAGDETISPTVEHDQGVAPILPDMAEEDTEAQPKADAAPQAQPETNAAPEAQPEADAAPEAPAVEAAPPAPPVEAAPSAPMIDPQGLEKMVSQVKSLPGGTVLVDKVSSFVDVVPQLVDNTNDFAAEQGKVLGGAGIAV